MSNSQDLNEKLHAEIMTYILEDCYCCSCDIKKAIGIMVLMGTALENN